MQESRDKIVVAYVCDQKYLPYLKISMASVKRYNKNVEFVALAKYEMNVPGLKTYLINPDTTKFKYKKNDRMREGVYYKLWLPTLPYDKVLYMDCDVVCQRPLYPLWDMECNYICATPSHVFGKEQAKMLGLERYALTGMMLMNLKKLREEDFTNRCLSRLDRTESVLFHDETLINLEFGDKITFIDKMFNYCHNRRYDDPIPEGDAYLLHYVGREDNKGAMLKRDDFNGMVGLKRLVKGKRVCIVGNSMKALGTGRGKEIDGYDVVIRFNKGFPWNNPMSLGKRTDILFLACTLSREELVKYGAGVTVSRSNLCKNLCDYYVSCPDRTQLAQECNEARRQRGRDNSQPSTGFIAVNFCLSADASSIDLYGFDFFASPTYYNPDGYVTLHNGDKEKEKMLEYEKYGLVTIHN